MMEKQVDETMVRLMDAKASERMVGGGWRLVKTNQDVESLTSLFSEDEWNQADDSPILRSLLLACPLGGGEDPGLFSWSVLALPNPQWH